MKFILWVPAALAHNRIYNLSLFCWKHGNLLALTKQFHQHCKIIQVINSIQKWLTWGLGGETVAATWFADCFLTGYLSFWDTKTAIQKKIYMVQKCAWAHQRPLHFQLTLARDKVIFWYFHRKLLVKSTFLGFIFVHTSFVKFMSGYMMVKSSALPKFIVLLCMLVCFWLQGF